MDVRRPSGAGRAAGKGAIAAGRDADFAVLAPEATFTVDPAALYHRNRVTAYAGRTLHGVVRSSWLRGERIGRPTEPPGRARQAACSPGTADGPHRPPPRTRPPTAPERTP
ncbi:Allantoinase [Streptomyces badius]